MQSDMKSVPPTRSTLRAACASLLAACTLASLAADPQSSKLYEEALVRFEKADYAGAVIQLKNALQIDNRQLPVQLLLGRALQASGDLVGAEVAFNEALRLGVNRAEVVVPMARAVLAQGRPAVILSDPRFVVSDLPRAVQAELMVVHGNAHGDLANLREARRMIEQARALNPRSVEPWLAEIPILIRARLLRDATEAAKQALALDPTSADVLYQSGAVAHTTGDLNGALRAYSSAIKLRPQHLESLLARAGIMLDMGRLQETQQDVDAARSAAPKDPRGHYLGAILADKAGKTRESRDLLGEVTGLLDPVPMEFMRYRPQLLILGGLSHFGLGQFEKAKPYLEMVQKNQPGTPADKLLAQVYLNDKNYARAIASLDSYLKSHPGDGQAQVLLATAHMTEGRPARAAQILQDALKVTDTPSVNAALGLSLMNSGKPEDALAPLEEAYKKDPAQTRAGAALTTLYLRKGLPRKAIETAEALLKREPDSPEFHNLIGTVRAQTGDNARARAAFTQALKLKPDFSPAEMNLARMDAAQGQYESAASHLNKVLSRQEKHVEALVEMGLLSERQGRIDDAVRWFEKAADHSAREEVRPGLLLMTLLLRANRVPEAQEAVKKLNLKVPESLPVLMANAKVSLAAKDMATARLYLTRSSRTAEFDAPSQVQVAIMQMQAQDAKGAQYSLIKALQAAPDHFPALTMMVEVDMALGDLAKAEEGARAIVARAPKRAVGHLLAGEVAMARGQAAAGVEAFRKAQQLEPSSANLLRLHRAVSQANPAAANQLAEQWLKSHPQDTAVRRALAEGYARNGDMAAARQAFDAVLKRNPDDVSAMNNQVHVLLALKDPGALKLAERAMALQPDAAHVIGTVGWAAHHAGQKDRALQLLRDARLRDPGNNETRYYLATVLASTGRKIEARQEVEAALKSGQRLASTREAQALLATLQ
jgi:putative PEP-CTERM system TPR-repeat lipoprotein